MATDRDKREILRERDMATSSAIELHTEADIDRERETVRDAVIYAETDREACRETCIETYRETCR